MSEHTYKQIELTGTSAKSSDEAIRNAVRKASGTVREMRWFELTELRGEITGEEVAHWQATIKIGFRLED